MHFSEGYNSNTMEYRKAGAHFNIAIVQVDEFRWPESAIELALHGGLQLDVAQDIG